MGEVPRKGCLTGSLISLSFQDFSFFHVCHLFEGLARKKVSCLVLYILSKNFFTQGD